MGTGKGETLRILRWSERKSRSPETPDADQIAEALRSEGYRVYEWTDPPGAVYHPHTHTTDQSHWVVRGRLALEVEGDEYVLGPGDRDWLPADTTHSARVVGDE